MVDAFSITDIGKKRQLNQDYVYASKEPIGNLPNFFVVADGMGGHNAGGYASRCAVETILEAIKADLAQHEPASILKNGIRRANALIERRAREDERLNGMGTTVVAATCKDKELCVANVGDSRLYLIREEEIIQITEDHSLVEEMVRVGGIAKDEARRHPDKNIITRAVGVAPEVEVDCFFVPLIANDIILLCSDGLTNMLEDEEIFTILKKTGHIREKAEALVEAANDHGGRDNIAVIVIDPFA